MANCEYCGSQLTPGAKFCTNCGHSVPAPAEPSYESIPTPMPAGDVVIEPPRRQGSPAAEPMVVEQMLVRTRLEYYIPKFHGFRDEGNMFSFNWSALLFGAYWMAYRKMYAIAAVMAVVSIIIPFLGIGLLSLALLIFNGVLGNYLYMKDIDRRTQKALDMDPEQRDAYIEKNGGTSFVPVVLLVLFVGLLGVIFS